MKKFTSCFDRIQPVDSKSGLLNVIIETPKGSCCKNDYDPDLGVFRIDKCLPLGSHFPYDFGYIPGTLGEDGDPLDVLVISTHPTFAGCLCPVHLIGVLEAEQTGKSGKTIRNDRLMGTIEFSADDPRTKTIKDVPKKLLAEVEDFFIYYNQLEGRIFAPLGWYGPKRAQALLHGGIKLNKKH